jgi:hypothetical protein
VIELLLQAERSLSMGLVDQAERLYRQAADADPRNSIAVVGLARVALERADDAEAWRQAKRALTIDPENAAAQRLVARLEEVFAHRGQPLPEPAVEVTALSASVAEPQASPPMAEAVAEPAAEAAPAADPEAESSRGIVDRLLGRTRT